MEYHVTRLVTRDSTPENPPCEVWRGTLRECAEYMHDYVKVLEKTFHEVEVGEGTVTATRHGIQTVVTYLECRALDMLERYLWDEIPTTA